MSQKNVIKFQQAVNNWLAENDPALTVKQRAVVRRAPVFLKASPEKSTNIAASSAVVVGECDYLKMDNEMKNADDPVETFKKYPLLGCTTVLDMARIASGYNPNDNTTDANKEKYADYIRRVRNAPFFHLIMNEHQEFHREESSWSDAINQISNLFTGVAEKDKSKISQSITNLANAVSSHSNTKQGTTLYSVSALNSDEHTVEAYIYSGDISMIESKSKGSDCKQTDIDIYKSNLGFDTEMWQYYAPQVYKKHLELVEDWLDDNTTKKGDEKTNLCIGGYKEIK